ncbi:hypothetical protein KW783_02380 [Candidatus Parcubacteria bacterium]|nr:hypothetical protein [Candidatus Parcubacteria bacterium]
MPELVYKKRRETPLEALERFRLEFPRYKDEVLSYAGRLDPMAEGLLIVLIGDENKKRQEYLGLPKEYTVEILFGFETDTHDILGKLISTKQADISKGALEKVLEASRGTFSEEYPLFSSKTVNGKALHEFGREEKAVQRPTHSVTIDSIELKHTGRLEKKELLNEILELRKVSGDFRQEEVIQLWKKTLDGITGPFQTAEINVTCQSGAYMRTLAQKIGQKLGVPALAYKIVRTKAGEFKLKSRLDNYLAFS